MILVCKIGVFRSVTRLPVFASDIFFLFFCFLTLQFIMTHFSLWIMVSSHPAPKPTLLPSILMSLIHRSVFISGFHPLQYFFNICEDPLPWCFLRNSLHWFFSNEQIRLILTNNFFLFFSFCVSRLLIFSGSTQPFFFFLNGNIIYAQIVYFPLFKLLFLAPYISSFCSFHRSFPIAFSLFTSLLSSSLYTFSYLLSFVHSYSQKSSIFCSPFYSLHIFPARSLSAIPFRNILWVKWINFLYLSSLHNIIRVPRINFLYLYHFRILVFSYKLFSVSKKSLTINMIFFLGLPWFFF